MDINECVFECCYELKEVVFEEGSRLTRIPESTFYECISLKEIHLPESIESIGSGAFGECSALECVYVRNAGINIGDLDRSFIKII